MSCLSVCWTAEVFLGAAKKSVNFDYPLLVTLLCWLIQSHDLQCTPGWFAAEGEWLALYED